MISPKILSFSWGKMEVEHLGKGKDFKLWPGGGRPWDWNEFGTDHVKGVQKRDVDELIENGAEVVILTKGFLARLSVPESTMAHLRDRNIEVVAVNSKKGAKLYNSYVDKGIPVGGLFHTTC